MANGENNGLAVRRYDLQFKALLTAIYGVEAVFGDSFALQTADGVAESENAFYVKTSDTPVTLGTYSTDDDCAFGDLTDGHSRFGQMVEIKYANTAVPYTWNWAIHEGLDRFTVNNDLAAAEADRLEAQAHAKIKKFNAKQAAYLASVATIEKTLPEAFDNDDILALFNSLAKAYANLGVTAQLIAYCAPDIYNAVVDHPLNNTLKRGDADIADNKVTYFKGFKVVEIPDEYFDEDDGDCVYTSVAGIGYAFTGINTVRTLDAISFDGREIQGAGKAGEFITVDNRKAVGKVSFQ